MDEGVVEKTNPCGRANPQSGPSIGVVRGPTTPEWPGGKPLEELAHRQSHLLPRPLTRLLRSFASCLGARSAQAERCCILMKIKYSVRLSRGVHLLTEQPGSVA